MSPARIRLLAIVAVVALSSTLLVAQALHYHPFFADDAFISLRYAQRLLHGQGLTWSEGLRVEGYSNLLWVLGCALIGLPGIDLVLAARLLGVGSAIAAIAALAFAFFPAKTERLNLDASVAASLILGTSAPLAVWAIGGLEQPLVAALLAWGLTLALRLLDKPTLGWRDVLPVGLLFGLLAWTRPDGIALSAAAAVGFFLARKLVSDRSAKRLWSTAALDGLRLFAAPAGFFAVQLAFRLAYYRAWVPNPALAKLAFTSERLQSGIAYLTHAANVNLPVIVLAALVVLPVVRDRHARGRSLVVAIPLLLWLIYVALIGGDIFPARRHIVPAVVMIAFLAGEAVRFGSQRRTRARFVAQTAAIVAIGLNFFRQFPDPESLRATQERWEWDGHVVGAFLIKHFGDRQPLLAADSAGTLPYFTRFPAIDLLGLNDRYMTTHRPPDFGHGPLGHELGNGEYVLGRQPDLIVFGLPRGEDRALYRSGVEMQRNPRFDAEYVLVDFEAYGVAYVRSRIWVRRSGPIGIRTTPDRIEIPGFFFASRSTLAAGEDSSGRLGVVLAPAATGHLRGLSLAPGRWRLGAGRDILQPGLQPEQGIG